MRHVLSGDGESGINHLFSWRSEIFRHARGVSGRRCLRRPVFLDGRNASSLALCKRIFTARHRPLRRTGGLAETSTILDLAVAYRNVKISSSAGMDEPCLLPFNHRRAAFVPPDASLFSLAGRIRATPSKITVTRPLSAGDRSRFHGGNGDLAGHLQRHLGRHQFQHDAERPCSSSHRIAISGCSSSFLPFDIAAFDDIAQATFPSGPGTECPPAGSPQFVEDAATAPALTASAPPPPGCLHRLGWRRNPGERQIRRQQPLRFGGGLRRGRDVPCPLRLQKPTSQHSP